MYCSPNRRVIEMQTLRTAAYSEITFPSWFVLSTEEFPTKKPRKPLFVLLFRLFSFLEV